MGASGGCAIFVQTSLEAQFLVLKLKLNIRGVLASLGREKIISCRNADLRFP